MPVLSSISRETDDHGFLRSEKFVSDRGAEYSIEPTPGGLYSVVQHSGGVNAAVCNGLYTSHLKAREALIAYLQSTDRLGYADYPTKPVEKIKKAKVVKNGPSEDSETLSDVR